MIVGDLWLSQLRITDGTVLHAVGYQNDTTFTLCGIRTWYLIKNGEQYEHKKREVTCLGCIAERGPDV